ncbi:MAG: hypothetical protein ABJB47_10460 [Actinomycetota bacterium]
MVFIRVLFSRIGILILIYCIIGVAVGPPPGSQGKLPAISQAASGADIGAWIQFIIWVLFWPIGVIFHHPSFSL